MRGRGRWWRSSPGALAAGTVLALVSGLGLAGAAASAAPGPVQSTPAPGTPTLAPTGTTEQVRQLAQCGGTMYAVGSFTSITGNVNGTTQTIARSNAFSFSATAPYQITSWNPDVNGTVNSIALTPDCSRAYLGGSFTSVHGTGATDIAKVITSTGKVIRMFRHGANGTVNTLVVTHNNLLAGGTFTRINRSSRAYLASLNLTSGRVTGYSKVGMSGDYQYPRAGYNHTMIYNQQISPSGTLDLVEGVFTRIGGKARQQIAMLHLGDTGVAVTGWTSQEFTQHCSTSHPFYVKAAAWSPDGQTIYVATTGFHLDSTGAVTGGLCDAAAAFSSVRHGQHHEWLNYTGCDSLFSVAADQYAVYVGGHERWADNPQGCNNLGPGGVVAPGMGGFYPAGSTAGTPGTVIKDSAGTAGYYSRSRGYGADDMLLTTAGLWIASDNFERSSSCGGVAGHAGICFLPYP